MDPIFRKDNVNHEQHHADNAAQPHKIHYFSFYFLFYFNCYCSAEIFRIARNTGTRDKMRRYTRIHPMTRQPVPNTSATSRNNKKSKRSTKQNMIQVCLKNVPRNNSGTSSVKRHTFLQITIKVDETKQLTRKKTGRLMRLWGNK